MAESRTRLAQLLEGLDTKFLSTYCKGNDARLELTIVQDSDANCSGVGKHVVGELFGIILNSDVSVVELTFRDGQEWIRVDERNSKREFGRYYCGQHLAYQKLTFVTAMSNMNGGTVRTHIDHFHLFPFFDASDRKRIQRTCGSIDRETTTAQSDRYGFPSDAIVIGENSGGDYLVLIPIPEHPDTLQHSIYWWDHETGQVERVADDFGDLPNRD